MVTNNNINNNKIDNKGNNLKGLARRPHDSPILSVPTMITTASFKFHVLIINTFLILLQFHFLRFLFHAKKHSEF